MYTIWKRSLRARTCTYARSMCSPNARAFKYHTYGNVPNNLSYGIFISQLVRLARINSTLKGFKNCVTELLGKLVAQGFKLAALRNKFVKFYKSRLNIWGKYGNDIYDEFIKMFQSPNIIL